MIGMNQTSRQKMSDTMKSWICERFPSEFNEIMENMYMGIKEGFADNKKYETSEHGKKHIETSEQFLKEFKVLLEKYNYI